MTQSEKTAQTDKIAAMLHDQCIDWNGETLADEAETRNPIYCGQLRAILAERGQLRVNLLHWREECGKLHARVAETQDAAWTRDDLAKGLAALDGITLRDIRSTVGDPQDANNWREYLGRADDLMAFLSQASAQQ